MNYKNYRNKNITPAILEKWIISILKDYEADELLQILLDVSANRQKIDLIDEMQSQLKYLDYSILKCQTLDERIKYEEFLDNLKPYYSERRMFE